MELVEPMGNFRGSQESTATYENFSWNQICHSHTFLQLSTIIAILKIILVLCCSLP